MDDIAEAQAQNGRDSETYSVEKSSGALVTRRFVALSGFSGSSDTISFLMGEERVLAWLL